jgi:hypothetical protein
MSKECLKLRGVAGGCATDKYIFIDLCFVLNLIVYLHYLGH